MRIIGQEKGKNFLIMSRLARFLSKAVSDIDEIYYYIAQDNPLAAASFLDSLENTVLRIRDFPYMGVARYQPVFENLRFLTVSDFPKYLVWYMVTEQYVEIVRILHSSTNIHEGAFY